MQGMGTCIKQTNQLPTMYFAISVLSFNPELP